jgi:CDP-diacylglycerol pyrophosphatase
MDQFAFQPAKRPRFGFRFSQFGWRRRAALVVAALVGSAAVAYATDIASRHALFEVVRMCVADKTTMGSPFPCLDVNLAEGRERGFIVLRPPIGGPDTILSPTRAILGLEDPQLQAPDAPNYFALAYEARRWLAGDAKGERIGLGVNSAIARSQDQLHVHMGCVKSDFADVLREDSAGPPGTWFRARDLGPGLELWTYRTGVADWNAVEPFRLLKRLVGDAAAMKPVTLTEALVRGELIVAALRSRPHGYYAAAEDVIDGRC